MTVGTNSLVSLSAVSLALLVAVGLPAEERYVLKSITTTAEGSFGEMLRRKGVEYTKNADGSVTASYKYRTFRAEMNIWPRRGQAEYKKNSDVTAWQNATGRATWSVPPSEFVRGTTWNAHGEVSVHQPEKDTDPHADHDSGMWFYYAASQAPLRVKNKSPNKPFSYNDIGAVSAGAPANARGEAEVVAEYFRKGRGKHDLTVRSVIHTDTFVDFVVSYNYEFMDGNDDPESKGLILQADRTVVDEGDKFSIPVYLRYRGSGAPPKVANVNFDCSYNSSVIRVLPHPNPASKPADTEAEQEPELPRGNLLPNTTLIAGNIHGRGVVRVGFAGKNGATPGTGRAGETVTEIYFKAVGRPGDKSDLNLTITTANNEKGRVLSVDVRESLRRSC